MNVKTRLWPNDDDALAVNEHLIYLADIFVSQADAAHRGHLANRVGFDRAMNAIRELTYGLAIHSAQADPAFAQGVFRIGTFKDNALPARVIVDRMNDLASRSDLPFAGRS